MEEYIFLITVNREKLKLLSPQQLQNYLEMWLTWRSYLLEQRLFMSAESFDCSGVKISGNGEIITHIKDCPISSLVVVRTESIDAAISAASKCPVFQLEGSVEIRQIYILGS